MTRFRREEMVAGLPGDDVRFERAFAAYHDSTVRYCARRLGVSDAADAAAEVFLVVWRRIDDLPEGDDAKLWIYGIARNTVRDQQRRRSRHRRLARKARVEPASSFDDPHIQVVRREQDAVVLAALGHLRDSDQEILRLKAWEELTHPEIAVVLGVTSHAVDMRCHRARKRLARALHAERHRKRLARLATAKGGER